MGQQEHKSFLWSCKEQRPRRAGGHAGKKGWTEFKNSRNFWARNGNAAINQPISSFPIWFAFCALLISWTPYLQGYHPYIRNRSWSGILRDYFSLWHFLPPYRSFFFVPIVCKAAASRPSAFGLSLSLASTCHSVFAPNAVALIRVAPFVYLKRSYTSPYADVRPSSFCALYWLSHISLCSRRPLIICFLFLWLHSHVCAKLLDIFQLQNCFHHGTWIIDASYNKLTSYSYFFSLYSFLEIFYTLFCKNNSFYWFKKCNGYIVMAKINCSPYSSPNSIQYCFFLYPRNSVLNFNRGQGFCMHKWQKRTPSVAL